MQKTILGIGLMILMGLAAYFFLGTMQKQAAQEAVPQLENVQRRAADIERAQQEAIDRVERAIQP